MPAVPALFVLLGLIKLGLVSNHEIIAVFRPHDEYWNILAAKSWVWARPYDQWTLIQLPVYALFIAVVGTTGIPLRVSIEVDYIVCSAVLISSLGRLGLPGPLRVVTFALLLFHPYTFELFDYALSEMLFTCQMVLLVGLFICVIAPKDKPDFRRNAMLFALTVALMWYCRKESVLIAGLLGLIACVIFVGWLLKRINRADSVRFGLALVVGPVASVITIGLLISTANGIRYGLWHTNELVAPSYVRALSKLEAIRPENPIRFIPVTRDARQKAYAVSPAFHELAPFLDGEGENWAARYTRETMGLKGEIAAGWFYWALIEAAAAAGHYKSAPEAQRFFGQIADEIDAALKDGQLPSRTVILPYVDPAFSVWLPHLPRSFLTLARHLFPYGPPFLPDRPAEVPNEVRANFDSIANRRTGGKPASYFAQGWALDTAGKALAIHVVDRNGQTVQSAFEPVARPDVGAHALGFRIDWAKNLASLDFARFKVLLEGDRFVLTNPISTISRGQVIKLSADNGAEVFFALDRLERPPIQEDIIHFIVKWYPAALAAFTAISVIYVFLIAMRGGLLLAPQIIVFGYIVALMLSRLLFFAILDASSWSALQTRYLLPIAVLMPVVAAIPLTFGHRRREKESANSI